MRKSSLVLLTLLSSALPIAAQPNEAASILADWEKAMAGLQSFGAQVRRVTDDRPLDKKDEHAGFVVLSKADAKGGGVKARLDLIKTTNKDVYERFICNGAELYEYVPANQTLRVHAMPKNKQNALEGNTLLSLVLGRSAKEMTERFEVKVDEKAQRDGYRYLWVHPKNEADKRDFAVAHLTFHRDTHTLARIHYWQVNRTEITWTFTNVQANPKLPAALFEAELPKGWRLDRVKAGP